MDFKNRISELMAEKGVRQADLCRKTNISTALMSNYVKGKASPSLSNAIAIADALDVTLDELAGRLVKVALDEEEQELISKFRELGDFEKQEIITFINYIYDKNDKKFWQKNLSNEAG